MALPNNASAAQLTEFLDKNDPPYSKLPKSWHETVSNWSSSEVRGVVQAARRNTSVKQVAIVPTRLNFAGEITIPLERSTNAPWLCATCWTQTQF